MPRLLTLLVLLSSPAASAATLTLTPGQTGTLGDTRVTLLSAQDHRCPINAICIRAGELNLSFLISRDSQVRLLKLQWPQARNTPAAGTAGLRVVDVPGRMAGSRQALQVTLTDDQP